MSVAEPKVEHEPLTPKWARGIYNAARTESYFADDKPDGEVHELAGWQAVIDAVSREVGSEFGRATLAAIKKDIPCVSKKP